MTFKITFIGAGPTGLPPIVAAAGAAAAGEPIEVSVLVREGPSKEALENGITVDYSRAEASGGATRTGQKVFEAKPRDPNDTQPGGYRLITNPADLEEQDAVWLGVPASEITPKMLEYIKPFLKKGTILISSANGITYAWAQTPAFERSGLPYVDAVDPNGEMIALADKYPPAFASVAMAAKSPRAGVAEITGDFPTSIGVPAGGDNAPLRELGRMFGVGGYKVRYSENMEHSLWLKYLGNFACNSLASAFELTLDMIGKEPWRGYALGVMEEGVALARNLGVEGEFKIIKRLNDAASMTHMPSTAKAYHQNPDGRNKPDIDAILVAILQIASDRGMLHRMPKTVGLYHAINELSKERGFGPLKPIRDLPEAFAVEQGKALRAVAARAPTPAPA